MWCSVEDDKVRGTGAAWGLDGEGSPGRLDGNIVILAELLHAVLYLAHPGME